MSTISSDPPSYLSLAAAALYVAVMMICLVAGRSAARAQHRRWQSLAWIALGALFVCLAGARVFGIEEIARDAVRDALRSDGLYDDRRNLQSMVIAGLLVIGAGCGSWFGYRAVRTARRRRDAALAIALAGGVGMAMLLILRLVSLHWVDRALYGALKLNWFADIGLSCLVLLAASHYVYRARSAQLRQRAKRSRPRR